MVKKKQILVMCDLCGQRKYKSAYMTDFKISCKACIRKKYGLKTTQHFKNVAELKKQIDIARKEEL